MLKNTAGQRIGAQLISTTDGSAFTGAATVYVTIDAGTQTIGSVGSGVCTHEGNGYHTYAPSQAETNGNLVAFTFVGSGAIATTVQVYTVDLALMTTAFQAGLATASAQATAQADLDILTGFDGATVSAASIAAITSATFSNPIETNLTFLQSQRLQSSILGATVSGAGSGTETFRAARNSGTTRVVVTVDQLGNRSSINYTLD